MIEGDGMSEIPYGELDANMVALARALNDFPDITTTGSCGGHGVTTNDSQAPAGEWWITAEIEPTRRAWSVLEWLLWAVNEEWGFDYGHTVYMGVFNVTAPTSYPTPKLAFTIDGRDNTNPDYLACWLVKVRRMMRDNAEWQAWLASARQRPEKNS